MDTAPATPTTSIVETEDDPTPIVLIVAATLRRAEETPKLAALMRGAKGNVALRSTVDPQAATIRFAGGRVRVERGVAPDADVTISTDVNRMADEDAPKPKVSGAATHARLALMAGKVLEPPAGPWRDEARRWWIRVADHPRMPRGIHVVCTDESSQITLGAEPVEFEIHGTAHRLTALFSGGTVFGQEVLDGHLYAVGSLEHLAELTGRSIDVLLGRRWTRMDAAALPGWLDEHDVRWVKTESVSLDGLVVGKHLGRSKFEKALPLGNAITELVLGYDMGGTPYLAWWDAWRAEALGDIHQRPDLDTLVVAPDRARTANVICDFVDATGTAIPSCPRGVLRHVLGTLSSRGFAARAAFEIEALLFTDSLESARRRHFADLTPMATNIPVGYLHHNSRQQLAFVDVVLDRLERLGIPVEGWHDEAAPGQFEINLDPTEPLAACDAVVRAKQVMREVALEQGHVVTFMAKPSAEYGNGLHVHHSLTRDGEPVFYAPDGAMSPTMQHWIGGLMDASDALTSFACPTINSYRRMVGFAAAPTVASWGEDNKSAALRVLSIAPKAARVEYRVAGGDANPYLVLASVLAAGIAGLDREAELPPPITVSGWGLPPDRFPPLPTTITRAADALEADTGLATVMGPDFVRYWLQTRRWEWLMFHTTGGDPTATTVTPWELDRYFELA